MPIIDELIPIIEANGGKASSAVICDAFRKRWNMYIDSSFRSGIEHVLTENPDLVRFNQTTKEWELGQAAGAPEYLYVSDDRTFNHIVDVMREVFGKQKVKSQCGYFDMDDGTAVWFPQYWNGNWENRLSPDGRVWTERPFDGHMTDMEPRIRFVFAHDKFGGRRNVYKFTGAFKHIEIRDDGTRVFEIIDEKVPIKGKRVDTSSLGRLLVCNIAYMKRYDGITDDDCILGGGGKYPTKNKDGGEKYNFHICQDGFVRGFVETLYSDAENHLGDPAFAKDIHIENIDPVFRGSDVATGIRVVFISKGLGYDKNVVVGWYENATVYRKRQSTDEQFGYNIKCAASDAFLIPDTERDFFYPKKNSDGTYNFGQSNISYPALFHQNATFALASSLNDYLDKKRSQIQPLSESKD